MQPWLQVATLAAAVAATAAAQEAEPAVVVRGRLREVRIVASDVFDHDTRKALEILVNALHWQTRDEVIRRELWFGPGDVIDSATAAELERNLRSLGLFGEAHVDLVPTGTAGEFDLLVTTRDRLTLSFGASASYVGGVGGVRATIGESNLFGYGNRINATYAGTSENEYRGNLSYTDLHVLDTWHTGSVLLSRTDEGDAVGMALRRPFKHLLDPRGYGVQWGYAQTEVDYFQGGDSVAEVPDTRFDLESDILWATGPRERRRRVGLVLRADEHDYEPATGVLAPEIRVPGDTRSVFLGPTMSWRNIDGFRKVDGLDTLLYVQDLTLGTDFGVTAGARWRDEDGAGSAVQPELSAFAGWAAEPLADLFTNVSGRAGLRWDSGDAVGWRTSLGARAFYMLDGANTLAANIAFDAVHESQDLPLELTLGEDNGLRGYPSRQFVGTRRLGANLEHRLDTAIELWTVRFGVVAFFDAGWVGRGHELGRPFTSAGAGLRIGSSRLLGRSVLRIDLARPLDDVPGEDEDWQLSVSIGQVFTFGGTAPEFGSR